MIYILITKRIIKQVILIMIFLFSGSILFAHPHIFIKYSVEIRITDNAVSGISSIWEFDKAYSSMLIMQFDKNKDGKLSPKEIAELKGKSFDGLIDYEFFTSIEINSRKFKFNSAADFSPSIAGNRMIYRFFIPINREIGKKTTLKINVFDPSIYIDFSIKDQPVILNASGVKASCELIDHSNDKSFMDGETAVKEVCVQITK